MITLLTFRLVFIAAVLALGLSPLLSQLATRLRVVDVPGSAPHKKHAQPVPVAGGWAILITLLIAAVINGIIDEPAIQAILLPSGIVFLFGVWDDAKGLSAPFKLAAQLLAAILLIRLGVYIQLFDPGYNWLNLGLTLFWIVGVTNAYNFVDSMDGLATGLAGLAAAFYMLVTFESQQIALSVFSTILLGACIGTYFYNASPAKLFLGDSGSQWLGFTLAGLAIAYNPPGFSRSQSWFIPILLAGIPIFDTTLVVFSRVRRGRAIYKAQFDHTYHRLIAFGVSPTRGVLIMHISALLLGCLAFITLSMPPLWANVIYGACLVLGAVAIGFMDSRKRFS